MYKVYIVEDEHLEREALITIIKKQAEDVCVVGSAASGLTALAGIKETDPDIILMDINIPEINGIEVLRRVKRADPNKKVILITAFNEFDFAHQAIKAKVDDFLLKPIRPDQLLTAIHQAILSLTVSAKNLFDEKMNAVIFSVVQKRYSDTRGALTDYVELLYDHFGYDLLSIQHEVSRFMDELNAVSEDACGYTVMSPLRHTTNNQHFVSSFQNRYDLKVAMMKEVDKVFDHLMDNRDNRKNTIEDILNYIDRNCYKDISLDQVGEYANMSSYYLSKIFKKETGVNFVTYLTNRKIEIAKDMLINTDVPIINIALDLSYHEPNYFSKVFKKNTGLTPTEFRRLHRDDEREAHHREA
ncbi:MAG: response regulator [Eubacteriaceae bacterium]|jgi:two-component system response regulator YesN|nr:response regulator [Eubacteriaceae bacterium]MDD4507752.1 response regulator [Eubacteriaceae bacterium]